MESFVLVSFRKGTNNDFTKFFRRSYFHLFFRTIAKGEEITFDYKYERYGQEAQKVNTYVFFISRKL